MTAIFVDTSFLLALVRETDEFHRRALAWGERVDAPLVTTELVLIEFADCCAPPALRSPCMRTIDRLRRNRAMDVIPATTMLCEQALSLFRQRPDKEWGATDCASFHVMNERGITRALIGDRDFEQAGFVALLRSDPPEDTK